VHEHITVAQAAAELGITPDAVRGAIKRGVIVPVRLDGRTNLIARSDVERYRRERLGRRGKYPRRKERAPLSRSPKGLATMARPITLVLTNEEATHLILALGLVIDPQVQLFAPHATALLARVRDRVLRAQQQAQRPATQAAD
jgi:excisionase family DNA binding protein